MLRNWLRPKRVMKWLTLLRLTSRSFFQKGGPTTAAAIAYFLLITLFPAFLLLVALGDQFIKVHGLSRDFAEGVIALFPSETRHFILTNLDTMISAPSWGSIITYASIFIWAGLWVFHLVEDALDKAWNVTCRRSFWARKLICLAMIGITAVCLLASTTLIASIRFWRVLLLPADWAADTLLVGVAVTLCAYLVMAFLFFLIYKIIPNTKVHFHEAFSGGLITSLMWHVANAVFVWSIPYFHYEHVYGSVWALVVFVVWIYVSCWIMLIGAHLTYHIHRWTEDGTLSTSAAEILGEIADLKKE